MKLSIIVPTIRTEKWDQLYASVLNSCTNPAIDIEMVMVGPEPNINSQCWADRNTKFIRSFLSPNASQQLGLVFSTGDIITYAADDCIFEPGMIDKCLDALLENNSKTHIVIAKYSEGNGDQSDDEYYKLTKAYPKAKYIEDDWWIFNCAFIHADYMKWLGGFDSIFQIPAFGYADLAVRAQRAGCKVTFVREKLLHCEHGQPDHGPIEVAHVYEDSPLYQITHENQSVRVQIPLDNYKDLKPFWSKRYAQV
jgi:glycosyltransferase involved in cell wall biosynthesis